jgi:O-antigen/teichoic acid export membrane protein
MSRLTRTSEPPLGAVFQRGLKLVIALSLPLTAAAVVLAAPIIRTLFGAEFEGGAGALRILAPGMTLAALSYLASHLLIGQDLQRAMARIYALIAVANIAANFILIPLLSLEGAALNTVVAEALIVTALIVTGLRMTGPLEWTRVLAGPLLATAVSASVMVLLRGTFALAAAAGVVAYVAVLLGFERRVYPEDAAQLAFRPGSRPSSPA